MKRPRNQSSSRPERGPPGGKRGSESRGAPPKRKAYEAKPASREPRHGAEEPSRAAPALNGGRYVYGLNPVLETLRKRPEALEHLYMVEGQLPPNHAAELFSRARDAGVRLTKVSRDRLSSMSEGGVHQGVVAEVREYTYAEVADLLDEAKASGRPALIVVLDGIQDPQNLGAIIRSAHALGAHGVVVGKDRAAGVTGSVAKASAGAVEYCRIARVVNLSRALEELKAAGLWIAAADPESKQPLWSAKLEGPLAIVVGAEGAGVRKGVLDHCDFRLQIPMSGEVASLNASVSAAILLYEAARQRRGTSDGA